jgi:hypothetical protein
LEITPYLETASILAIEALLMASMLEIRVFYSSRTFGGFKGRTGLEPVCHSCDKQLGIVKDSEVKQFIPPEVMPLVFSAELAAQELGVTFELIDINRLSMRQRVNERLNGKPVPRVSIGDDFVDGSATKDEIVALFHRMRIHNK